mgnify:CR=1 FL=1
MIGTTTTTDKREGLESIGRTELVDQSLAALRLLHDALLVVLADGPAQLVVVHRRPILPGAPQLRHADAVLDLEDALGAVQPADAAAVLVRPTKELLQKLPQVNVRAAGAHRGDCHCWSSWNRCSWNGNGRGGGGGGGGGQFALDD